MNISLLRSHPHLGIFTRNHKDYLDGAAAVHKSSPTRPVAFRSQKRWATARDVLQMHKEASLYMAPIGGEGLVTHVGKLMHVHLEPRESDEAVKALLGFALPTTQNEGLWGGKVDTLYLVTHTRALETPFPIKELIKLADGLPISEDYGYGYSVVHRHRPAAPPDPEPSDDRNFGFCKYSGRWVPRDSMVAVNVKAFMEEGNEEKVRIRLSKSAYAEFWQYMQSLEWDNVLLKRNQLPIDAPFGE